MKRNIGMWTFSWLSLISLNTLRASGLACVTETAPLNAGMREQFYYFLRNFYAGTSCLLAKYYWVIIPVFVYLLIFLKKRRKDGKKL
jgi:hypothetical protein